MIFLIFCFVCLFVCLFFCGGGGPYSNSELDMLWFYCILDSIFIVLYFCEPQQIHMMGP